MSIRWPVSVTALDGAVCGARLWRGPRTRHVTIVVKATVQLVAGGRATLLPPEPIVDKDRHYQASPARSVEAASEIAPYLPRCDVTLRGHAHAPPGQSLQSATVRLSIVRGQPLLDKQVFVYGDRDAAHPERTATFQRLPIDWEHALGGKSSKENPVGRGTEKAGVGATPPNVVNATDATRPGGFAPLSRFWADRASLLGGVSRAVVDADEPEIFEGYDWRYYQSAPSDQQIHYLVGDEWIVIDGMHPALPRISTQLPTLHGAALMYAYRDGAYGPATPLKLEADMLSIDADRLTASIVWRGSTVLDPSIDIRHLRLFGAVQVEGAPIPWPSPKTLSPPTETLDDPATTPLGDETQMLTPEEDSRAARTRPAPFRAGAAVPPPPTAPSPSTDLGGTITLKPEPRAPSSGVPFSEPPKPAASSLESTMNSPGVDPSLPPKMPFAAPPPPPAQASSLESTVKLSPAQADKAAEKEAMPFKPGDPNAPAPVARSATRTLPKDKEEFGETISLKPVDIARLHKEHAPFPIAKARVKSSDQRPPPSIDMARIPRRESPQVPIVHEASITAATTPWQIEPPQETLTLIVKASFEIIPGQKAKLCDEPAPLHGDVFDGDDPEKALLEASDFAIMKPRCDVLFSGSAFASGNGATHAKVSVKLADGAQPKGFERSIAVVGDRQWQGSGLAPSSTSPKPFKEMPIVWSRAFGGPKIADNPVGIGNGTHSLPNLESLEQPMSVPDDKPTPVCFGPIASTWRSRRDKLGTYGGDWHVTRFPYFPVDFKWAHFQSAPVEQQVDPLVSNEAFEIRGMHPEHPVLTGTLPSVRARAFALETEPQGGELYEIDLRIDTVHFDVTSMRVDLVWRGTLEVSDEEAPELERLFVMLEDLASAPCSLDEAKRKLIELASPPEVTLDAPVSVMDLPKRKLTFEEKALYRLSIEKRLASDESFDGADFADAELIDLDFSGRSLVGAIFKDAKLRGSKFENASLEGALFAGADLTDADLRGAKLDAADFVGARLERAKLDGAAIDSADFSNVIANGASFTKCTGAEVQFVEASLIGAKLDGAELPKANFGTTVLDGASFVEAKLPEGRFYWAKGEGTRFDRAQLVDGRVDDSTFLRAIFTGVLAMGSIWEKAILTGCDFTGAELTDASFTRATCDDCSFEGIDAKEARFIRAKLSSASFKQANLMAADFERANLKNADLRGANLHAAETLRATLEGALLEGAIVTKSKLAARAKG